jgi:hypothetical protein
VLLNYVAELLDSNPGFDMSDGFIQALSGGFDEADIVWICESFVADVVSLIEITVVALVEKGDIEVEDIAVFEWTLVRNAVADDLVDRGAVRLGEMIIV